MLNGAEVHEGYAQYNEDTIYEWGNKHSIQSVYQASFYELACSSSDTLNSVFEDIGRNIDEEEGLKQLKIWGFSDQNTLAEWPLSQLVSSCFKLEQLTIWGLSQTTEANKSQILEFAALAATNSSCLHTLHIECTESSAKDGDKMMQVLADHDISWLQNIKIRRESRWFENNRDGCMAPLLVLLAR